MRPSPRGFIVALLALEISLACGMARAQTPDVGSRGFFTCKDAQGRTISSDRFITECADREQREYSPSGALRRVIEPPLTPEQKRLKDAEDKKKADAELAAAERRRLDRVLLQSYSSAAGIDVARERALTEPRSGIEKSKDRLVDLRHEREQLRSETEFYKNRALPADLETRIKDNEAAQLYEEDLMNRRNAEVVRINERYDADKTRFLQLTTDNPRTSN
jgi:hypothetical protein